MIKGLSRKHTAENVRELLIYQGDVGQTQWVKLLLSSFTTRLVKAYKGPIGRLISMKPIFMAVYLDACLITSRYFGFGDSSVYIWS